MNSLIRVAIVMLVSALALSEAVSAQEVPGTVVPAGDLRAVAQRLLTAADRDHTLSLTLPEVSADEMKKMAAPARGKRVQIGFPRTVPDALAKAAGSGSLRWKIIGGGRASAVVIRSPGAVALRAAIEVTGLPEGGEIRFYSVKDAKVYEPITAAELRRSATEPLWSPVIEGDSLGLEVYIPEGADVDGVGITMRQVSHLLGSVMSGFEKLNALKASQSCEIDIVCQTGTWGETAKAVAKMVFTDGGGTYLCTGTLLNDTDTATFIPYFLTAYHCISTQTVASTLNTYFFYDRPTCGGTAAPSTTVQLTGGATLLSGNEDTDYSFHRLNNAPPGGVNMAGWSASTPTAGLPINGIHHPAGDVKKISFGGVTGFDSWNGVIANTHIVVQWSSGVTEGGSSGSGIWRNGTWPNQYLIGILTGGASYCWAPSDPDYYGRFDMFYSAIQSYLNPTPTVTVPTAPTLVAPLGTTSASPAFSWNSVSNATSYRLWVNDSTGKKLDQTYTATAVGCAAGGVCSITPSLTLAAGSGAFWVLASNTAGSSPWSGQGNFTVPGAVGAAVGAVWQVASLAPGGTATLWALVNNTGGVTFPAGSKVWFFVNGPGWSGSNWVGSADISGMAPGNGAWRSFGWSVPSGATPGTYTYWAQIYTGTFVSAWSSGQSFTVTAPPVTAARVDSVFAVNGGTVSRGATAVLWAKVTNSGNVALPAGSKVWFFVNGPSWGSGSNWVGATLVEGLAPGASTWYALNWPAPSSAATGTYTYWAQVWGSGALSPWSAGQTFIVQ